MQHTLTHTPISCMSKYSPNCDLPIAADFDRILISRSPPLQLMSIVKLAVSCVFVVRCVECRREGRMSEHDSRSTSIAGQLPGLNYRSVVRISSDIIRRRMIDNNVKLTQRYMPIWRNETKT